MKVGILGYGEIGSSLKKVYDDYSDDFEVRVKDLYRDDDLEGIEILNICIPYSEKFETIVSGAMKIYNPTLTIIHSTVVPGTTLNIYHKTEQDVVHSPVRGVHPNLYEGIKTFTKYVGADSFRSSDRASKHLESLGITVEPFSCSKATELAKILSTTYYGLIIAWHGEMKRLCDEQDVAFEETVTRWNEDYNQGYTLLDKFNVVRPTLYPPEEKIGGHCVIPNTELLKEFFESDALDFILKYK